MIYQKPALFVNGVSIFDPITKYEGISNLGTEIMLSKRK